MSLDLKNGMDISKMNMNSMPKSQEEMQKQMQQKKQQEEQIETMLRSICDSTALDRIKRVALVKPERANMVKQALIQLAQRGQIKEKVNEGFVTKLLSDFAKKSGAKSGSTIQIQRKQVVDDDSDSEDLDDLMEGL